VLQLFAIKLMFVSCVSIIGWESDRW